ncbi:hypothetical protein [Paenibacillus jilunlii]|uniref:Uncharacterized protein n=1 Tax=Paenibacillus jilunlii TaxID=682956 RepID=A0A1G9J9X1_9BACL|nr:hypothetical protein [Paenibacillus jilunlii]KWX74820.1 hypothetical protein AML91_14345 [Paenibacillus jilunlii]SDL34278.1 hypothetical protein SAMN05216191_102392 [Paenibacillus jilunlii]
MSAELRISIQGENPPSWAVGNQNSTYFSYYENEHGEQWVARLDGKTLCISGLDIDWEEIELNAEQAVAENNRIVDQIVAVTLMQSKNVPESVTKAYLDVMALHQQTSGGMLPLAHIMFGAGELLWLASVLNATVVRIK